MKLKVVLLSSVINAIWCNQSRRSAAERPAFVYNYIRWQLLQRKETTLGVYHQLHWEEIIFYYWNAPRALRQATTHWKTASLPETWERQIQKMKKNFCNEYPWTQEHICLILCLKSFPNVMKNLGINQKVIVSLNANNSWNQRLSFVKSRINILFRKRRKRSRPFVFPYETWLWHIKNIEKSW